MLPDAQSAEAYAARPFLQEDTDLTNHFCNFSEMTVQARPDVPRMSMVQFDKARFIEAEMFEDSSGEESVWDYALCNTGTAPIQKEPPVDVPRLASMRKIGGRPGCYAPPPTARTGCDESWGFSWLCLPAKLNGVVDYQHEVKAAGRREAPPGHNKILRQCETICDDDGN